MQRLRPLPDCQNFNSKTFVKNADYFIITSHFLSLNGLNVFFTKGNHHFVYVSDNRVLNLLPITFKALWHHFPVSKSSFCFLYDNRIMPESLKGYGKKNLCP